MIKQLTVNTLFILQDSSDTKAVHKTFTIIYNFDNKKMSNQD